MWCAWSCCGHYLTAWPLTTITLCCVLCWQKCPRCLMSSTYFSGYSSQRSTSSTHWRSSSHSTSVPTTTTPGSRICKWKGKGGRERKRGGGGGGEIQCTPRSKVFGIFELQLTNFKVTTCIDEQSGTHYVCTLCVKSNVLCHQYMPLWKRDEEGSVQGEARSPSSLIYVVQG